MGADNLTVGSVVAGRYRILRALKAGGMGAVYEALHIGTEERVALKTMHPDIVSNADLRERFTREAKVSALIQSRHVVTVRDAGIDEGTPFLVMELLAGEELGKALERGHVLPHEIVEIVQQIARGLDRAHAAGVVHRDLKPENLFLSRDEEGKLVVKILDFGIAKMLQSASTTTIAGGTAAYMAPEQTKRGKVTAAADIWALGLVVFRLLTGRSFWDSDAIGEIVGEILSRTYPKASQRAHGAPLPAGFDAWFARCVAFEPSARFATAGEAAVAFARLYGVTDPASAQPVLAAVPSSKRRLAWIGGGVLAAAGLATAAILATTGGTRSRGDERATASATAPTASVLRSALGVASSSTSSTASSLPTESPKPCWVTRQPRVVSAKADKSVPIEAREVGQGLVVGFAIDELHAGVIDLDPKTGAAPMRSVESRSTLRRVVPTGRDVVLGTSDQELIPMAGSQLSLKLEQRSVALVPSQAEPWRTSDPISALQLLSGEEGRGWVTLRAGDHIFVASIVDAQPGPLRQVTTGDQFHHGKPRLGNNGRELALMFARSSRESSVWQLQLLRAALDGVSFREHALELPPQGPGGDLIAPDLVGLADGRWLVMWTEGSAGERSVRAQTYDPNFGRLGDPIALSVPGGNFGQATVASVGPYVVALFLAAGDEGYSLHASVLQCSI